MFLADARAAAARRAAAAATAPCTPPFPKVRRADLSQPGVSQFGEGVVVGSPRNFPRHAPRRVCASPKLANSAAPPKRTSSVEQGRQLRLGRQLLAVAEQSERDRAAHPPCDRFTAQRPVVEGSEHGPGASPLSRRT